MKTIGHLREGLVALAVAAAFLGGAHLATNSTPATTQQSSLENGLYVPAGQADGKFMPGKYVPGMKFPGGKFPGGKFPGGKFPGVKMPGSYRP